MKNSQKVVIIGGKPIDNIIIDNKKLLEQSFSLQKKEAIKTSKKNLEKIRKSIKDLERL